MADVVTIDSVHTDRQNKLRQLQDQVKEYTEREIRRLDEEAKWLEGLNRAAQARKETDEILFLNELDELLGAT
jgi:hypothetical protein